MNAISTANALLHKSCAEGNFKKAEIALNYGANPNHQDRFGVRPILIAVQNCDYAIIDLLMRRGADPRCLGRDDLYPMALVAMTDNIDVLDAIGSHCWDAEAPSQTLPSALEHALAANKTCSTIYLLDHGADVHGISADQRNLAMRCSELQNTEAVSLLHCEGALWFQKDRDGQNVIDHLLANRKQSGDTQITDALIHGWIRREPLIDTNRWFGLRPAFSHGAYRRSENDDEYVMDSTSKTFKDNAHKNKISARNNYFWYWLKPQNFRQQRATRVLMQALRRGDLAKSLILLRGSDIIANARDENGTPLPHLAVQCAELCRLFLAKDTLVLTGDSNCLAKQIDKIEDLLSELLTTLSTRGVSSIIVDAKHGNTIAHELLSGTYSGVFFRLYDLGLYKKCLNRSNFKLDRPLHIAVRRRNFVDIDSLLARSCDRNPVNKDGHTPLHHCALHVDSEVASRLISAGANYELSTRRGQSIKAMLESIGKKAHAFQALLQTRQSLQKVMGIFSHDNPMSAFVKQGLGQIRKSI